MTRTLGGTPRKPRRIGVVGLAVRDVDDVREVDCTTFALGIEPRIPKTTAVTHRILTLRTPIQERVCERNWYTVTQDLTWVTYWEGLG